MFRYIANIMIIRRVTIIKESNKPGEDINKELQWLSKSLGMFNERDKESSQFRIFIELVKARKKNEQLSSEELAEKSNLTRGTVVHHLDKLRDSGLIENRRNRYFLSEDNLTSLMDDLEDSVSEMFKEMKKIARKIDEEIGLR